MIQYRPIIEAMFRIVNRRGQEVDFILNPQQRLLDEQFTRRNIIPKGRQGAGVSTYHIARFVAKCLAEDNRRCVIVSAEADATARLLDRARFILRHLKGVQEPPKLGTDNVKAITFLDTNSSLWIGTAGSRQFGRGDTITDLLLSEASIYANAEELARGLFPAAEHGEISVESTGNGVGNWYHEQCLRARERRGFNLFFFPSQDMSDNSIGFDDEGERDHFLRNLKSDLEEPELAARGIKAEFIKWRRERIEIDFMGDLRAFKQEHPTTFDECFQSTGFTFFVRVKWEPVGARWHQTNRHLHILQPHPKPGCRYVIGADVGGGVGRDNSVGMVLDLDSGEQVAEWVSGHREPHEFGDDLAELGKRFNNAYINCERNNHGLTTLKRLVEVYPLELLHRGTRSAAVPNQTILSRLSNYGTLVTTETRGLVLDAARGVVSRCPIHSEMLYSEMGSFCQQESGKVEANAGCLDDRVMAYAHAASVMERAQLMTGPSREEPSEAIDPFSFEGIFNEKVASRGSGPIHAKYG